jgi:hypothetical protein
MTGEIRMGLPEEYPAPWMFEKIVCGTAHEAECWSQKMREQESARERLENEKREEIEEHMKAQLRSHIRNLMVNARNNMNREFLRRHLELYDERPAGWKTKRKSYLHAEAFEHGR